MVGVFVPALVIMGILLVVVFLRKRPQPTLESCNERPSNVPAIRCHEETSYPPSYEDIELRISSNTEYAEVADMKGDQRIKRTYENFEPTDQKKENQYDPCF